MQIIHCLATKQPTLVVNTVHALADARHVAASGLADSRSRVTRLANVLLLTTRLLPITPRPHFSCLLAWSNIRLTQHNT